MQLLLAFARQLQFTIWHLLCLLDERMQYHNAAAEKETVEGSADTGATTRTKLEEPVPECARMRKPQAWAMLSKKLDKAGVVRQDIDRPRLDLGEHALVEVLDLERYDAG